MILWRLCTSHQTVEYTGAPQKRFARSLWLILASIMFVLLVILNTASPINFIICGLCLIFLFFETVFGICIWCELYNVFNKDTAQYCPWWVCERQHKEPIQYITTTHASIVWVFIIVVSLLFLYMPNNPVTPLRWTQDCIVPERAKAIGHEALRLEHNWCTLNEWTHTWWPADMLWIDDPCTNIPEWHPRDLWLQHNWCL